MQIIPAIDIIDGHCVRLTQGDYSRKSVYDASPAEMVHRYVDHGMNRIHAVDLDGAKAGHPVNTAVLEGIACADGAFIEWSGGIADDKAMQICLEAGASAVVIGSAAVRNPGLFSRWLGEYGADKVVLGADLREGKVSVSGWCEDSSIGAEALIERFLPFGLNQAIVTEISRDGMLCGPAFDLYASLAAAFPAVCFTVSGGISCADDIRRLADMGLPRVIVGKAIYEGHITLDELEKLNTVE